MSVTFTIFVAFLVVIFMLAIYGNWMYLDEDGFAISVDLRPGFVLFWWFLIRHPIGMYRGTTLQQYAKYLRMRDI